MEYDTELIRLATVVAKIEIALHDAIGKIPPDPARIAKLTDSLQQSMLELA